MATMVIAEPIWNREPGISSKTPKDMQGLKHFGDALLLFQNKELDKQEVEYLD